MNILYGLYRADEGEILSTASRSASPRPRDAIAAGIGMVHQHFMLVPGVHRRRERRPRRRADRRVRPARPSGRPASRCVEISAQLRPRRRSGRDHRGPAGRHPAAGRDHQGAVPRRRACLIFDEPTAVLTPQEIEEFFDIVRSLRADGKAHRLHHPQAQGGARDRRPHQRAAPRARWSARSTPAAATEAELAEMMVGRAVDLVVQKDAGPSRATVVLAGRGPAWSPSSTARRVVDGVSFEVRAGEIVGIAGVQGNGQTELVEALTGCAAVAGRPISSTAQDITGAAAASATAPGSAHVPEDRQRIGLVGDFAVAENMRPRQLLRPARSSRGVTCDWPAVRAARRRSWSSEFDVRTPSTIDTPTHALGRQPAEGDRGPRVPRDLKLLIAAQPTRGLDVGSIEYIHERIVAARDEGVGGADRLDRARRGDGARRPHPGDVPRADRRRARPRTTTPGEIGLYMAGRATRSRRWPRDGGHVRLTGDGERRRRRRHGGDGDRGDADGAGAPAGLGAPARAAARRVGRPGRSCRCSCSRAGRRHRPADRRGRSSPSSDLDNLRRLGDRPLDAIGDDAVQHR